MFRGEMRGSDEVVEGILCHIYMNICVCICQFFTDHSENDALQAQKAELACQVGPGGGGWAVVVGVRNTGREIDRWKIGGE